MYFWDVFICNIEMGVCVCVVLKNASQTPTEHWQLKAMQNGKK